MPILTGQMQLRPQEGTGEVPEATPCSIPPSASMAGWRYGAFLRANAFRPAFRGPGESGKAMTSLPLAWRCKHEALDGAQDHDTGSYFAAHEYSMLFRN